MELDDFAGKVCSSKISYEFHLKESKKLDLGKIAEKLESCEEVFVEVNTPYLLVLRCNDVHVSFFQSGKLIVKEVPEKEKASEIAGKIMSFIQ